MCSKAPSMKEVEYLISHSKEDLVTVLKYIHSTDYIPLTYDRRRLLRYIQFHILCKRTTLAMYVKDCLPTMFNAYYKQVQYTIDSVCDNKQLVPSVVTSFYQTSKIGKRVQIYGYVRGMIRRRVILDAICGKRTLWIWRHDKPRTTIENERTKMTVLYNHTKETGVNVKDGAFIIDHPSPTKLTKHYRFKVSENLLKVNLNKNVASIIASYVVISNID